MQRDLLLSRVDAFDASGAVLADSPIPSCVDHGDLWPGNVLAARAGGRHRFIDFTDAAWTHPFLSLMPVLFFCRRRWSVPGTDHPSPFASRRFGGSGRPSPTSSTPPARTLTISGRGRGRGSRRVSVVGATISRHDLASDRGGARCVEREP